MTELEKCINEVLANKDKSMQELISSFVEQATVLTKSEIGYFAVMNSSEDVLVMIGWSITAMSNCSIIDKPIVYALSETGMWGDAVRERKAVVTNDYANLEKETKKGYPSGHVNVIRHFNIPIWEDNHITGILGVGNKSSDYDDNDVENLQKFTQELWSTIKKEVPNELLQ